MGNLGVWAWNFEFGGGRGGGWAAGGGVLRFTGVRHFELGFWSGL